MNVMSVGKPSAKRHISPYTRETIQEKDPIHVVNAENPSPASQLLATTREPTQKKMEFVYFEVFLSLWMEEQDFRDPHSVTLEMLTKLFSGSSK